MEQLSKCIKKAERACPAHIGSVQSYMRSVCDENTVFSFDVLGMAVVGVNTRKRIPFVTGLYNNNSKATAADWITKTLHAEFPIVFDRGVIRNRLAAALNYNKPVTAMSVFSLLTWANDIKKMSLEKIVESLEKAGL